MSKRNLGLLGLWLVFIVSFFFIYSESYRIIKFDYLRDMLLAFIGASVTILITSLLLRQQTESEELKDTHAEIFKKKFEIYEEFFKNVILLHEDSNNIEILRSVEESLYKLMLFTQHHDTFKKIHNVIIKVLEDDQKPPMAELIYIFREELGIHPENEKNEHFYRILDKNLELLSTAIAQKKQK